MCERRMTELLAYCPKIDIFYSKQSTRPVFHIHIVVTTQPHLPRPDETPPILSQMH